MIFLLLFKEEDWLHSYAYINLGEQEFVNVKGRR